MEKLARVVDKKENTISKGGNKGKPYYKVSFEEPEGQRYTISIFSVIDAKALERGKTYRFEVEAKGEYLNWLNLIGPVEPESAGASTTGPAGAGGAVAGQLGGNAREIQPRDSLALGLEKCLDVTGAVATAVFTGHDTPLTDVKSWTVNLFGALAREFKDQLHGAAPLVDSPAPLAGTPAPTMIKEDTRRQTQGAPLAHDGPLPTPAEELGFGKDDVAPVTATPGDERQQKFALINKYAAAPYRIGWLAIRDKGGLQRDATIDSTPLASIEAAIDRVIQNDPKLAAAAKAAR